MKFGDNPTFQSVGRKGSQIVLAEMGNNCGHLKAPAQIALLKTLPNWQLAARKSQIQELFEDRGHFFLIGAACHTELASKEHFISPFNELKQEVEPLIRQIFDQLPAGVFTRALAKLFGIKATTSLIVPLAEPISEREKGVLECIARGLSNQEVADKLHISLHTVKTHARRINAKLGVKSRTQAIVRARELGVL